MKKTCIITAKVTDTVRIFLLPFVSLLEQLDYQVKVIAGEGRYSGELTENNLLLEKINYSFTLNPLKAWKLFYKTRRILLLERPSLVVCNDPSASFITRLAARNAGVRNIIYFCHGFPFAPDSTFFENMFFYTLEKVASYATDSAIMMNDFDYEAAKKLYGRVYRINGVGVDLSHYNRGSNDITPEIRQQLGIPKKAKVVAFIGRLIPKKGLKYFLRAAKEIILSHEKSIVFLVAGDGPLRKELLEFIKANNLGERLKYVGYSENIKCLLRGVDLLVLPTYYAEGLPRVILEAMASGVPVIATNVRGCKDIIQPGIDGILIPPRDSASIIRAVRNLVCDISLYESIRVNAQKKVMEKYELSIVLKQFENILNDLHPV